MSKDNLFLGTASGKLGDVVMYRANGKQVARVKVTPKNPRSYAQMAQRVRMAGVTALYRAGQKLLKNSFTIRRAGESSYNAFARNAINISPFFSKAMVDNCLALPMPVQASRGTLQPVVAFTGTSDAVKFDRLPSYGLDGDDTIGEWSAEFINANPTYKNGDKVIFMYIVFTPNEEVQLEDAYNASSYSYEILLNTDSAQSLTAAGWQTLGIEGANDFIYPIGTFGWSDDSLSGADCVRMSVVMGASAGANGELLVSSEYFTLTPSAADIWARYRSTAAMENSIASYGTSGTNVLSV